MGLSIHQFDPDGNILTVSGYIAMKYGTGLPGNAGNHLVPRARFSLY